MTNSIQNIFSTTGRTILSITCMAALLAFAPAGTAFAEETELSTGTAAAVSETGAAEGNSASGSVIGAEAAENYAFADAGIDPFDVDTVFAEYDQDEGQFFYDVDFTADGTEYEYHIDAYDGSVLEKSVEFTELKNTLSASANTDSSITSDEAKEIVLAHTGLSEEELALVTFTKEKSDYEDELAIYEFEFSTESIAYEYEISSNTGDILSFSEKVLPTVNQNAGNTTNADSANAESADSVSTDAAADSSVSADTTTEGSSSTDAVSANSGSSDTGISLDEAKAIALETAGFSESDVVFKKAKLDKEDGIMVYEIEFYQGQMEYECEINAATGAIIEFEAEWDD
ncbi:MAG: PepSY domain-containing protein [Lachnospiraceae bacterium]|nr:PepSY domain-containing protein [Lachnospiraceae bacterium]